MEHEVPADYPRNPYPSRHGGQTPTFVTREVDGKLVVGFTEEEVKERYALCLELLRQLVPFGEQKRKNNPQSSQLEILQHIQRGVQSLDSGLSAPEIEWLVRAAARRLGWSTDFRLS